MAIFNQIEARILVDNQPLHEYEDPDQGEDPMTDRRENIRLEKYIQSAHGKNFAIELKLSPGIKFKEFNALEFTVSIDGKELSPSALLLKKRYRKRNGTLSRILEGVDVCESQQNRVRKFRFQALQIGETTHSERVSKQSAQVGTIQIVVRKANVSGTAKALTRRDVDLSVPRISEKQIKGRATDTATTLDTAEDAEGRIVHKTSRLHEGPIVTYIFHYYSRDGLEKLGIIERPRSPTPLEDKDEETLTLKEARELVRKQKATLQARQLNLKREMAENNSDRSRTLVRKRESSSPQDEEVQVIRKQKKIQQIEVIELD